MGGIRHRLVAQYEIPSTVWGVIPTARVFTSGRRDLPRNLFLQGDLRSA